MTILDKITQSEMVGVGLWTVFVVFLGYKAWQAWFRRKAGLAKNGDTFDATKQPVGYAASFAIIHIGLLIALVWGCMFAVDVLHRS